MIGSDFVTGRKIRNSGAHQRFSESRPRDIGGSLIRDVGGTLKTNHSIPLCCPLRLSDMDLPIEPHLLGVWLGDGSRDAPLVHCDHNDEPHYQRIAQAAGESWRILSIKKDNVLTCTMSPWRTASVLDPASDAGRLE